MNKFDNIIKRKIRQLNEDQNPTTSSNAQPTSIMNLFVDKNFPNSFITELDKTSPENLKMIYNNIKLISDTMNKKFAQQQPQQQQQQQQQPQQQQQQPQQQQQQPQQQQQQQPQQQQQQQLR